MHCWDEIKAYMQMGILTKPLEQYKLQYPVRSSRQHAMLRFNVGMPETAKAKTLSLIDPFGDSGQLHAAVQFFK